MDTYRIETEEGTIIAHGVSDGLTRAIIADLGGTTWPDGKIPVTQTILCRVVIIREG